jgi:hypothetical protein
MPIISLDQATLMPAGDGQDRHAHIGEPCLQTHSARLPIESKTDAVFELSQHVLS